jgi:hypothetical protein
MFKLNEPMLNNLMQYITLFENKLKKNPMQKKNCN